MSVFGSLSTAIRAALLLLLLVCAPFNPASAKFYGYVRFFERTNFDDDGAEYWYYTADSNRCINLSCFEDKASSVKWKNLPTAASFDKDGWAKIAFFTGANCTGTKREWKTEEEGYPYDLSKDGIDNAISSFIIYETDRSSKGNMLPCPWGHNLF